MCWSNGVSDREESDSLGWTPQMAGNDPQRRYLCMIYIWDDTVSEWVVLSPGPRSFLQFGFFYIETASYSMYHALICELCYWRASSTCVSSGIQRIMTTTRTRSRTGHHAYDIASGTGYLILALRHARGKIKSPAGVWWRINCRRRDGKGRLRQAGGGRSTAAVVGWIISITPLAVTDRVYRKWARRVNWAVSYQLFINAIAYNW